MIHIVFHFLFKFLHLIQLKLIWLEDVRLESRLLFFICINKYPTIIFKMLHISPIIFIIIIVIYLILTYDVFGRFPVYSILYIILTVVTSK